MDLELLKSGQIAETQEKGAGALNDLTEAKTEINKIRSDIGNLKQELQNKEFKLIEILGIFITLFTFISVNVNIFTRVNDIYTAIWFMFLMTICSIIILSALFVITHNKDRLKEVAIVVILLILLTGWLVLPHLNLIELHLNPIETKIENNTTQNFFK